MQEIPRLIALDMDGSLCTTDKRITPYTAAVLERAAASGALIVPATGRFYKGLPQILQDAPYVRYCITINGAHVYDALERRTVAKAEIPCARAVEAMEYLDTRDVIYLHNPMDNPAANIGLFISLAYKSLKNGGLSAVTACF